jgi:peroxiredoxin
MPIQTPACDIGMPAKSFVLPDVNGQLWDLDDFNQKSGLVVAFICNHCPYVKAVIQDFVNDANQLLDEDVGVVAIMSNDYRAYPDDSPEKMFDFATEYGFRFPYLLDESQEVARTYDAVCTPDFFGFDGARDLQYRGRLDNLRMEREGDRSPDLVNAMREIKTTGRFSGVQLPSAGCSIKWKS